MNLNKSREYFDPSKFKDEIHIIGCGAIGSAVAELLARLGVENLHLHDFDKVETHNIANQMFSEIHVGWPKVKAVHEICYAINPAIKITKHGKWEGQDLKGYIFMAVDSIETRKEIAKKHQYNMDVKGMFDFRMRLTDAQHYATTPKNLELTKVFLDSMNFTKEEAKEATPMSACNIALSVAYAPRAIVAIGVANFINLVKNNNLKKFIQFDLENMILDAF